MDELLNTAPCGFLSFTDDGTIALANATLLELLKMEVNEVVGQNIERLLPIASRIFYQTYFFPLLKLSGKAEEIYFSLRPKHGNDIPILVSGVRREREGEFFNNCILIPIKQRIQYEDEILKAKKTAEAAMLAQEQTEARLKQNNEELGHVTRLLEKLVNTDELTQVANRRCFNDSLAKEWLRLCREQSPLSILLLDVDYFKRYNDFYGHQLGDTCLVKVAQSAQRMARRPSDLAARYGGEEFVVLLPDTTSEGATTVAEQVHQAINSLNIPHQASPISNRVTISLGIATMIPTTEVSPGDLLHQADQALYRAKQQGRNQSVIFS